MNFPITGHALLRWFERIEGHDIPSIKSEMRDMGHANITDKDVLGYLWTQFGLSQNAIGQRIKSAMKSAVRSEFGPYLVCVEAVLVVDGGRVVTVLTHALYEDNVRRAIAGRLRRAAA